MIFFSLSFFGVGVVGAALVPHYEMCAGVHGIISIYVCVGACVRFGNEPLWSLNIS